MKLKFLLTIVFLFSTHCIYAETFDLTPIDFFQEPVVENTTTAKPSLDKVTTEKSDLWTTPVRLNDGSITAYRPPQVVVDFLENPNKETGRAYLDWSRNRFENMAKAQSVLQEISGTNSNPVLKESKPTIKNQLPKISRIDFYLLKGCPYCEQLIPKIMEIFNSIPKDKFNVYAKGYTDNDTKTLSFPIIIDSNKITVQGITKYPTTIVTFTNGTQQTIGGVLDDNLVAEIIEKGR